jgi:hypothetical protein
MDRFDLSAEYVIDYCWNCRSATLHGRWRGRRCVIFERDGPALRIFSEAGRLAFPAIQLDLDQLAALLRSLISSKSPNVVALRAHAGELRPSCAIWASRRLRLVA